MKVAGSFGLRACQNPRPGGVPDHFAIGAMAGKLCSRISGVKEKNQIGKIHCMNLTLMFGTKCSSQIRALRKIA